jgi:7,8-dihydropterin-6-yl-methyl-4-(beta-D-ribofuranosyl)aminobenzene 5'-phosphate synthase
MRAPTYTEILAVSVAFGLLVLAAKRPASSTCCRTAGSKDGLGCDPNAYIHHFTVEELAGKPQPDQHLARACDMLRLGDRGLVVIGSCGHAGIINTLRRAQEVSGVEKIYAVVGGFHLAPAPDDYLRQLWRS